MTDEEFSPPRTAQLLLLAVVPRADAESIPGDLLEQYREVQRPLLGRLRADAWYLGQVFSLFWHLAWAPIALMIAFRILWFPSPRSWNPSLVPAPGLSAIDAAILMWAGYYGAARTGRFGTGILLAATTAFVGIKLFFTVAALLDPTLVMASLDKPFIAVIATIFSAMAIGFGIAAGAVGAAVGRWFPPAGFNERRTS